MPLHSNERRDVLEDEIEDPSPGNEHQATNCSSRRLESEVAKQTCQRPQQAEPEHHRQSSPRSLSGRYQFAIRVESFREVLCSNEDRQQDAQPWLVWEHCSKRDGFRQEVEKHCRELRSWSNATARARISPHEEEGAGEEEQDR